MEGITAKSSPWPSEFSVGSSLAWRKGQLKTGQDGKGLLQSHLWCPNNLASDRIEKQIGCFPIICRYQ